MPLPSGCHHVALLTEDLDRFTDFWCTVFDAEVVAEQAEDGMRHSLIDLGGGFHLHPFQLPGGAPGDRRASSQMFGRGHVDHLAVGFDDPAAFEQARRRLVARGASDGRITDFGLVETVSFEDPDGMDAEISIRSRGRMLRFEERVVHEGPVRSTGETARPSLVERVGQFARRIALSLSRRARVVAPIGPALQA